MSTGEYEEILAALDAGERPQVDSLSGIDQRDEIVQAAVGTPDGRRWLASLTDLGPELASRLLAYEEDFRSVRRNTSAINVVRVARDTDLAEHSAALAAGSTATAFWERLSADPEALLRVASELVLSTDTTAAENMLYLLVLDPIDQFGLGEERRSSIARAGLGSDAVAVRTLAAEYLFDHEPATLADDMARLVHDEDERVRGLAWAAGFREASGAAFRLATGMLGNEDESLPARRSALATLGTHLDTADVIETLAYFVGHPSEELALDAGNLLYRLHRHPTIAMAAIESPHESVREIGAFLLDPYRGSPAAGGSRPGDPTHSDIFAELIRQTEDRVLTDDPEDAEKQD